VTAETERQEGSTGGEPVPGVVVAEPVEPEDALEATEGEGPAEPEAASAAAVAGEPAEPAGGADPTGVDESGEPSAGGDAERPADPEELEEPDEVAEPAEPSEPIAGAETDEPAASGDAGAPGWHGPEEVPEGAEAARPDATAGVPESPVRASSMDSTSLPERSRHDADPRQHRPRRSVDRLPVLVAPVDIPEDAAGRIEFVVVRAGEDRDQPEPPDETPSPAAAAGRVHDLLALGSGWVAVGGLATLLIIVFVVIELIYR